MRLPALTILCAIFVVVGMLHLCYRPTPAGDQRRASRCVATPSPEVAEIERRSRVKDELAGRFIAERTPLLEAAELFELVNGEDGMTALRRSGTGRSVREKLCRQVICYVMASEADLEREGHAPTGPRASAGLQDELDRRIAAGEFPPEPGMD